MGDTQRQYLPALAFRALTPLYDPVIRWTMREDTFRERLVRQADVRAGHRVLDLGCGTGSLAVRLAQAAPGAEVVGIDPDPEVLRRAAGKAARAGVDVRFEEGSAESLPYGDGAFDRVVSSLVFHHLGPKAKRRAAAEIFRVLRPGGELHVADWGRPQNGAMRAAFFALQLLDGFATTAENVAGRLPDIFRQAGFTAVAERDRLATPFGTLALYSGARGAGAGRPLTRIRAEES
jgi:ubiquinone/menaquinone biosynthesis C-methylase UbiE